jgi:prepilin-type N-terminal cleavage/methylation domain-containing protein
MKTTDKYGFTLVEIMIVVGIIGLIAAMAMPSFLNARKTAQQNACINNLRVIDGGKQQCALVFRLSSGRTIMSYSVNEYIRGCTTPLCPTGGTYSYGNIGSNPLCTISSPTSHLFAGNAEEQ